MSLTLLLSYMSSIAIIPNSIFIEMTQEGILRSPIFFFAAAFAASDKISHELPRYFEFRKHTLDRAIQRKFFANAQTFSDKFMIPAINENRQDFINKILEYIVHHCSEQVVEELIKQEPIVNQLLRWRDRQDCTPLIVFVERNFANVAPELIKRGASTDERNWSGEKILMIVARHGYLEMARNIIKAKRNIVLDMNVGLANNDPPRSHSLNPLFYAARFAQHRTLELLLESGVDPNTKSIGDSSQLIPDSQRQVFIDLVTRNHPRLIPDSQRQLIDSFTRYQESLFKLYSLLSRHRGDTPFTPTANDLNLTDKTLFHNYSQLANVALETEQQEPFTSLQTQEIEPITRPDHPSLARSLLSLLKKNNHKVAIEKARCKTSGCVQVFLDVSGPEMDLQTLLRFSQALGKEPKDFWPDNDNSSPLYNSLH